MNKTININLGGVFFHIDEVAYQKLKGYLDAIRRSLSDDPQGRDEIITDIETRIGELLSDKVKDVRQVVNESDIDEVIEVMGKPEDYMVDDEIFSDDGYTGYSKRRTKKLCTVVLWHSLASQTSPKTSRNFKSKRAKWIYWARLERT